MGAKRIGICRTFATRTRREKTKSPAAKQPRRVTPVPSHALCTLSPAKTNRRDHVRATSFSVVFCSEGRQNPFFRVVKSLHFLKNRLQSILSVKTAFPGLAPVPAKRGGQLPIDARPPWPQASGKTRVAPPEESPGGPAAAEIALSERFGKIGVGPIGIRRVRQSGDVQHARFTQPEQGTPRTE